MGITSRAIRSLGFACIFGLATLAHLSAAQAAPVVLSDDVVIHEADNDGAIYAMGDKVSLTGVNNATVWAAGGTVYVDMVNKGDVIAMGENVGVAGVIQESVVAIGDKVALNMTASADIAAIGDLVVIGPEATVGGESSLYGKDVEADGTYAGPFTATGDHVTLSGQFAGDVSATGDLVVLNGYFSGDVVVRADEVTFGDGVQFLGDLTIQSPEPIEVPEGIFVGGRTEVMEINYADIDDAFSFPKAMRVFLPLMGIGVALVILMLLFTFGGGAIVIALTGDISRRGVNMLRDNPGKSFLYGLAVFFAGLIAVVIAASLFTPLGVLAILYGLAIMVGTSFGAYAIFTLMVDRGRKPHGGGKRFGFALLSTFLLFVVALFIPILGPVLVTLAIFFGLGAYFGGMVSGSEEIAAQG